MNTPHPPPRRIAVASWVLYDLGNTLFMMGVVSTLFPLFLRNELGADAADPALSLTQAIAAGVVFLLSPVLGAMTDYARRRVPYLVGATLICVAFTLLMGRWSVGTTMVLFALANIAFQASVQFYDALLPEVSTKEDRSKISGIGVGVGFIGSYVAIGITLLLPNLPPSASFSLMGATFLLFAWPAFFFIKERPHDKAQPFQWGLVKSAVSDVRHTIGRLGSFPGLPRFLIGRALYTDAANTVAIVMSLFTLNVAAAEGMSEENAETQMKYIYMFAITFAVVGGAVWGRIATNLGPKRALQWNLYLWMGVFLLATFVAFFVQEIGLMYLLASLAGIGLAGNPATDRPLLLELTPPDKVGEFFGLYAMVGRFSAVLGPLTWAGLTTFGKSVLGLDPLAAQGLGTVFLAIMVLVGFLVIRPINNTNAPGA